MFDLAGNGIAAHLWAQIGDGDVAAIGLARMHQKLANAEPGTTWVADVDGQPVGGIISYDIGAEPEPIPDDTLPILVPMIELENLATGTHHVNAVAVFEGFRGRGIAGQLMDAVEANAGPAGTSLIVFDNKPAARALYRARGYRDVARRPVVPSDWDGGCEAFILMIKDR